MLGKLIKYELRASSRLIPFLYLGVVVLAAVSAVFIASGLRLALLISYILLVLAGSAAIIITYIVVAMRFYKGLYGREGYLAMTLPVTPTQLYLSKGIVAFVWMLLGTAVGVAALIWGTYSLLYAAGETAEIAELNRTFSAMLYPRWMIAVLCIASVLGILIFLVEIYFCIVISSVKPFHSLGVGAAVIAYVILNAVTQIASAVTDSIIPFGLSFSIKQGWSFGRINYLEMLENLFINPSGDAPMMIGLGSYLIPILFLLVLPPITTWLMRHKSNLR